LRGGIPVTTDYVLAESITLLRMRTGSKEVGIFFDAVLNGVAAGRILLERIDEARCYGNDLEAPSSCG